MADRIETGTGLSIAIITAANTCMLSAADYLKKPYNPQAYWNYQEAHWKFNGHAMGLAQSDLVVSDVLWTEDQMRQFMGASLRGLLVRHHDLPFYLPEVVSGKDGLSLLGKAYPWMKWNEYMMASVQNVDSKGNEVAVFGHLRTEAAINAPYTKTTDDQAADILVKLGRRGHTLNTYAEAGNQSKLLVSKYLDEARTWSRVMLSRAYGRIARACHDPNGGCGVDWSLGAYARDFVGVRYVEV